MVAIGPRGTAYTAAAFEIFADLYYRTSACVGGAFSHQALRTFLGGDTRAELRAELGRRMIATLDLGLAPTRPFATDMAATQAAANDAVSAETTGPAGFALQAVWARLASAPADPGVLGAAYLAAEFTSQIARRLGANWPTAEAEPLRALTALSTEAGSIATALRHRLLESLTEDPARAAVIFRGFDRLAVVYPMALLDDAVLAAMESREVA